MSKIDKQFQILLTNKQQYNQLIENELKKPAIRRLKPSQKQAYKQALLNERDIFLNRLDESATSSYNIPRVAKIILPTLTRFWPKLFLNDLVGMVTLDRPTGYIRLFKAIYKDTELPGIVPDTNANPVKTKVVLEGLEDNTDTVYSATLENIPVVKNTVKVKLVSNSTETVLAQDDGEGKIINTNGSGISIFGTIDYKTGVLKFVSSGPIVGSATDKLVVSYQVGWEGVESSEIPEVHFDLEQFLIETEDKKLRARWTMQAEDDIRNLDGLDISTELQDANARIIAQQINMEVLYDILAKIPDAHKLQWARNQAPTGFRGTRTQWYADLYLLIKELQARIQNETRLAEANVILVNPRVEGILKAAFASYGYKTVVTLHDDILQGGYKNENLSSVAELIVSPVVPDNKIILGFKSDDIRTSPYIYAPYVPLKAVYYADSKGDQGFVFLSRYGKLNVRPTWYGQIEITDMDDFGAFVQETPVIGMAD